MAFLAQPLDKKLGQLTEISGGEYKGDKTIYVSTAKVLEDMGMMKPSITPEFSGAGTASAGLTG